MPYNLIIINGPNLGHLGERQPEIYGNQGIDVLPERIAAVLGDKFKEVEFSYYQSNHEGDIIDRLEKAYDEGVDGVIINAGAFTHTSLALGDCLAWIKIPFVEVHLSNTQARAEEIRHKSLIAPYAKGVIAGFGLIGYGLAAKALLQIIKAEK